MSSPVLSLNHIHKHYTTPSGEVPVLHALDLKILPGELVALVGPSGSGKSTLLHIAGLLDTPQQGTVMLAGEDASNANDSTRTRLRNRNIGFIYQFHHLLPELSAIENVMMPQSIAGVASRQARERARMLLSRLGLESRLHHVPAELSGGEQQRVAIARALANQPPLILADEPTGNLDPKTADTVTALLLEIAREQQIAALIATHNMQFARALTRAVTLRDGHIVTAAP